MSAGWITEPSNSTADSVRATISRVYRGHPSTTFFPPPQVPIPDPVFVNPFKPRNPANAGRKWRTWQDWDSKAHDKQREQKSHEWGEPDEDLQPYERQPMPSSNVDEARDGADNREQLEPPSSDSDDVPAPVISHSGKLARALSDIAKPPSQLSYTPLPAASTDRLKLDDAVVNFELAAGCSIGKSASAASPGLGDGTAEVVATAGSSCEAGDVDEPFIEPDLFSMRGIAYPTACVNTHGTLRLADFHDRSPAYPQVARREAFLAPAGLKAMGRYVDPLNSLRCQSVPDVDLDSSDGFLVVRMPGKSESLVPECLDLDAGWDADQGWSRASAALPMSKKARKAASAIMQRDGWGSSGDTLTGSTAEQWAHFDTYDWDFPELHATKSGNSMSAVSSEASRHEAGDDWSFSDIPSNSGGSVSPGHSALSVQSQQRLLANFAPALPSPSPSLRKKDVANKPGEASSAMLREQSKASDLRRQQAEMLRQYSSMAVERARDPWAAADADAALQAALQASLMEARAMELEQAAEVPLERRAPAVLQIAGTSARIPAAPRQSRQRAEVPISFARLDSAAKAAAESVSSAEEEEDDTSDDSSSSIGSAVPRLQRQPARPPAPKPRPRPVLADGELYCRKCRRHFGNSHRLLAHYQECTIIHPYYCRSCMIDWPTFAELHIHYAEESLCRPPELSSGRSKGFLQILVDHQASARPRTPIAQPMQPEEPAEELGRWWHRAPPSLDGFVDPHAHNSSRVKISDWITAGGSVAERPDLGSPDPNSRNYGSKHLPRLYRELNSPKSTSPRAGDRASFADQQDQRKPAKGKVAADTAASDHRQATLDSGPEAGRMPDSDKKGKSAAPRFAPADQGLSEEHVNTVESKGLGMRPRRRKVTSTEGLEPPSCPICITPLMEAREVVATACGHVYCAKCLLQMFSRCGSSCPKCRTPLGLGMIIPIHMH